MPPAIIQPELDADREDILALWQRNLPEAAPTRFDWLYRTGHATSWIVRNDRGEALGSIGLMERILKVFDQMWSAGQPIDLNVDRRWRIGGTAIQLQRTVTNQIGQGHRGLVYGFPNAESEPVLRRVGYRRLAGVGRWVKPLVSNSILERWLHNPRACKAASTLADAALRLASPELAHRRPKHLRVEVTDVFDERFDQLWEAGKEHFPIVGRRTADYLQWRFAESPGVCYRSFCLCDPDDRLLAYLVYHQRDGVAYLADFFFAKLGHFDVLLGEFVRVMRQHHAEAIVTIYTGAASVASRLLRAGFHRRTSPWNAMIHAADDRLLEEENWFLTRADIDTDF